MSSADNEPGKSSGKRTGGIRTISDLNRHSHSDSKRDSDNRQEYYTGGEKSGMLVQDPSKGYDVDGFFDRARQLSAAQGPLENLQPSSSSRSFTGTGRLLSNDSVPNASQQPESVMHNVVFWRNGFTVNDGPLRRFDDPDNTPFLESLLRSEVPKDFVHATQNKNSPVQVHLIRMAENFPDSEYVIIPPIKEPELVRRVPFQGTSRTLGSSSSTTESTPIRDAPPLSSHGLVVDSSLPLTSIQIRLTDGTRVVANFNHQHTVADIRVFIDTSRPNESRSYELQAVGFPPRVLSDATQTIEEAGLLNSVVIQKL